MSTGRTVSPRYVTRKQMHGTFFMVIIPLLFLKAAMYVSIYLEKG